VYIVAHINKFVKGKNAFFSAFLCKIKSFFEINLK